jgi:hypothetical protein
MIILCLFQLVTSLSLTCFMEPSSSVPKLHLQVLRIIQYVIYDHFRVQVYFVFISQFECMVICECKLDTYICICVGYSKFYPL